jgi:glutamate dehydrogenase/leucine dehydrogenase
MRREFFNHLGFNTAVAAMEDMAGKTVLISGDTPVSDMIVQQAKDNGIDVVVVDDAPKGLFQEPPQRTFTIKNPYKDLPQIQEGKKFICKGKHRYESVKQKEEDGYTYTEWICQCGRKL